ncbi:hypothetical protein CLV30_113124 [Haloactinopolyspora alba]|uniref:Uncharacterized protein n=1 Tax=Haloactinopolyspora alba TaxID=648780 RepID=A0A2P8DWN3_9ACTN|nr:hypothetical protein CLV30_113124 [Haloactinopolyspora alba]
MAAQRLPGHGVLVDLARLAHRVDLVGGVVGRGEHRGAAPCAVPGPPDLRVHAVDGGVGRDAEARGPGLFTHRGDAAEVAEHAGRVRVVLGHRQPQHPRPDVPGAVGRLHDDEVVRVAADTEALVGDGHLPVVVPHLVADRRLCTAVVLGDDVRQRDPVAVRDRGRQVRAERDRRRVVGAAGRAADPYRCGDDGVAVGLGRDHVEEVAVVRVQLVRDVHVAARDAGDLVRDGTAVGQHPHGGERLPAARVGQPDVEGDARGAGGEHRPHHLPVAAVRQHGVDVLGGVHAPVAHRLVGGVLALLLRPDARGRLVAGHPVGAVLVAVPHRRQVPAGVQGELVLRQVGGVLHLDQLHPLVHLPIEVAEGGEVALAVRVRVVELCDGVRILFEPGVERRQIVLQVTRGGAERERVALAAGRRQPVGVEQVDVTGVVVPGDLLGRDRHQLVLRGVERRRRLVQVAPLVGDGVTPVCGEVVTVAPVEQHVVVGDGEEVGVAARGHVLERVPRHLDAVADRGVRVELPGVVGLAEVRRALVRRGGRAGGQRCQRGCGDGQHQYGRQSGTCGSCSHGFVPLLYTGGDDSAQCRRKASGRT